MATMNPRTGRNFVARSVKGTTMERKSTTKPSFFQILIHRDFTRSLKVPLAFGQRHKNILTENMRLRIGSGETWDVKVEQTDDGHYYFTKGWEDFARDLKLERSDFIGFTFDDKFKSTFDVTAWGSDGCGKEYSFPHPYVVVDDDDELLEQEEEETNVVNPKFVIVLQRSHISRVSICKNYAEEAGLIGKKRVVLEYQPGGYCSSVVLDFRSKNMRLNKNGFRLDFAKGWRDFRKATRMRFYRTYSFEFIPWKGVIQVKEV
ncbi:hypothetical protein ABFS83_08G043700 [Erythranthe nasuta]